MCNCGKKRNAYAEQSYKQSNGVTNEQPDRKMWTDTYFEYTGNSGLTVSGGVTGKRYRFNQPGDIQLIDYRDASGMMAVTLLKRVKNSSGI